MKISIFVFGFVFAFFFLAIHVRQGNAINEVCHKYLDLGLVSDCSACDNSTVTEDRNHTTWSFQANMDDQILECNLEPNTTQNVSGTILSVGSLSGFPVAQKFLVRIDLENRQVTRVGDFSFDTILLEGGLVVDPISHILFLSASLTVGDFNPLNRSRDYKLHRISTVDGSILSSVRPTLFRDCMGADGPDCFDYFNLTVPDGVESILDGNSYNMYWGGKRYSMKSGDLLGRLSFTSKRVETLASIHPITGRVYVHIILPSRGEVMEFDPLQEMLYVLSHETLTIDGNLNLYPRLTVYNVTSREVTHSGEFYSRSTFPGKMFLGLIWDSERDAMIASVQNASSPVDSRSMRFSEIDIETITLREIDGAPVYPYSGQGVFRTPLQTDYSNRIYVGSAFERRTIDVIDERNICPVASEDVSDIHTTDYFIHEPICLCCLLTGNDTLSGQGREKDFHVMNTESRLDTRYTPKCNYKSSSSSHLSISYFVFLSMGVFILFYY